MDTYFLSSFFIIVQVQFSDFPPHISNTPDLSTSSSVSTWFYKWERNQQVLHFKFSSLIRGKFKFECEIPCLTNASYLPMM